MAEVQKSTNAGETAQRFIEFVMMQAQNASLFLGLIPNPQTGKGEVNLELARLFIDQLSMIQEKTRGNLSSEETNVLRNALSNLQMAFFEVSQGGGLPADEETESEAPQEPASASSEREMAPPPESPAPTAVAPEENRNENRKRFTKSYGA
jgi:hypothetical protein